ncbi:hypothetical protein P4040_004616 [Salmonella enterica]|nr:hypothetical protein [Salmonella enterica]EKQ2764376.1 hypothetical protein [Salmonella enterica]
MIEYQFNYFLKKALVESAAGSVISLMGSFKNKFLPTFVDEMTPGANKKAIRMVGIEEYDGVSVLFASESIHVNILYRDRGLDKVDALNKMEFINNAINEINSTVKAWRLSVLVTSIDRATDAFNSKMYNKYFGDNASSDYFEWNVRRAKKSSVNSESLNIITVVNRNPVMNAFNPTETFDAIVTQIDVNTSPEVASERFDVENELMSVLLDKAEAILSEEIR